MILSLSFQAELFLTTVAAGFAAAFAYDILKVLRYAVKHSRAAIHIEDALYWVCVVMAVFFVLLNESFGEIRGFCVCGVFLGMVMYFASLSRLFLSLSEAIVNIVKKIAALLIEIVLTPFKLLYKIFRIPCKKAESLAKRIYKKILLFAKIYAKIYTKRLHGEISAFKRRKPGAKSYGKEPKN